MRDFETKINQLRLAEMGVKVAKEIDSSFVFCILERLNVKSLSIDPQVHLAFLTSLLSRIDTETSKEAHVLLLASIAHAKLLYGDLEGTKSDMDAAWKILDMLEGVDNGVNAAYYGVGADYYKVPIFFHGYPLFLCSNIKNISTGKSRIRALLPKFSPVPCLCGSGERYVTR